MTGIARNIKKWLEVAVEISENGLNWGGYD